MSQSVSTSASKTPAVLLAFFSLLFLYSLSFFQRTALPGTLFNQLQTDLGLTATQLAMVGTAFLWVYSPLQTVIGIFEDKYSGIRVALVGGFFFALGSLLFPLCSAPWLLYLCRMMQGLGASAFYLSLVKESENLGGRQNFVVLLGLYTLFGYSGSMLGTWPLTCAATRWPWQHILTGIGIFTFLIFGIFTFCAKKITLPPIIPGKISLRPLCSIIKNPLTWYTSFITSAFFGFYFIVQSLLGKKFLTDCAGFSDETAATVIFFMALLCPIGTFVLSLLCRFTGNRRLPFIRWANGLCLLNTVVFLLALHFHWNSWIFVITIILYALPIANISMLNLLIQEVNRPKVMAQAAGFGNMLIYFWVIIASIIIGKLLDWYGGTVAASGTIIYGENAYKIIAMLALIPLALTTIFSFFILPETNGKYLYPDEDDSAT